ncbi:MAG: AMP-binding protein [Gammaproteobacteria bacterium]|nr:AMP-binding protein [Gammaproteobacteria bacterium]
MEKITTLTAKLSEIAWQSPRHVVMKSQENNRKVTYQEFHQTAQQIAYFLSTLPLRKKDRVAIVLENCPEWGMIYFGILFSGCIAIPLDPQSNQEDMEYFLSDSGAKVVFTSETYQEFFECNTSLKSVIVLKKPWDKRVSDIKVTKAGWHIYQDIIQTAFKEKRFKLPKISPADLASILYTSGTTGRPKGVMLTHANFYANFESVEKSGVFQRQQYHLLSILPLHHSFPFMATLLVPLFIKGQVTYVSSLKSDDMLSAMRENEITVFVGVPQIFYLFYNALNEKLNKIHWAIRWPFLGWVQLLWLLRKTTRINLARLIFKKIHHPFGKSLKFFVCGGAKLDKNIERFFFKYGFTLIEGYGLTETAPVVTFNPLAKPKIGSAGKVIPGVSVKIIDADEQGIGEIAISGPNVMQGYYHKPQKTKESLKKGWFYSGDLGYFDHEGYLFITGRKKELIVLSSGKNITPEEVETYYAQSPYIQELCVLLVGSKTHEEKLMAVIVPNLDYFRKTGEINVEWSIKWSLETLSKQYPAYKRIMGFVLTHQELPKTRLGKLKRFQIYDQYQEALLGQRLKGIEPAKKEIPISEADLNILASPLYRKLESVLKLATNRPAIRLEDHLEIDLGFDSLSRVELSAQLEKALRVLITPTIMAQVFTVRELYVALEKIVEKPEQLEKKGAGLRSVTKTQSQLWQEILNTPPRPEIARKIAIRLSQTVKTASVLFTKGLYGLLKVFFWIQREGGENLPRKGPYLLCPNHNSYLDPFLIAATIPNDMINQLFFIGFRAFFETTITKKLIRLARTIPIDPGVSLIDAMQASGYVLKHNKILCIFPEAARSIDGNVQAFKKGIGILGKELQVNLVPVYIKGSFDAWPRGRRFFKPHPIKVIFGKPYTPEALQKEGKKLGAKDDYEAIALALREKVIELSHSA